MSLLDDNEVLMNDSEKRVYNHMIHKEIEWNPYEYQSFYNFREWMKTNIYKFNDDVGRIDERCDHSDFRINSLDDELISLNDEINLLKTEIMNLKYIISKNI